jgi:hypothetical protein
MKANRTRALASGWIIVGLAIFVAAVGQAVWVYTQLGTNGPTGAGMVSLAMVRVAYVLMTVCNIMGGAVLLVSSRNSKVPVHPFVKIVAVLATVAQVLPFVRWLFLS